MQDSVVRVHLREVVAADSDFIFDVRRQAFRQYVEAEEGWNEAAERERHDERFANQRFRMIVVEADDVGYLATKVYPQATAKYPASLYVHQLMVLPAFQSRGIGLASIRLLAPEAQTLDLPIRLSVLRVNPRALAFYLAAGCKVVGKTDSHISLELQL